MQYKRCPSVNKGTALNLPTGIVRFHRSESVPIDRNSLDQLYFLWSNLMNTSSSVNQLHINFGLHDIGCKSRLLVLLL